MERIIKETTKRIKADFINARCLIFKAYNRMQEDETDGTDYIFDLNKQKDLVCCIKGGLTAEEIAILYNLGETKYFHFNANKGAYSLSIQEMENLLFSSIDDIVRFMFAYPFIEEYKELYTKYVTKIVLL